MGEQRKVHPRARRGVPGIGGLMFWGLSTSPHTFATVLLANPRLPEGAGQPVGTLPGPCAPLQSGHGSALSLFCVTSWIFCSKLMKFKSACMLQLLPISGIAGASPGCFAIKRIGRYVLVPGPPEQTARWGLRQQRWISRHLWRLEVRGTGRGTGRAATS